MINLVTLGAVHTHTHTNILLLNKKQGLEVALFVVSGNKKEVSETKYIVSENKNAKNKCLKRRVLKNRLCF